MNDLQDNTLEKSKNYKKEIKEVNDLVLLETWTRNLERWIKSKNLKIVSRRNSFALKISDEDNIVTPWFRDFIKLLKYVYSHKEQIEACVYGTDKTTLFNAFERYLEDQNLVIIRQEEFSAIPMKYALAHQDNKNNPVTPWFREFYKLIQHVIDTRTKQE